MSKKNKQIVILKCTGKECKIRKNGLNKIMGAITHPLILRHKALLYMC